MLLSLVQKKCKPKQRHVGLDFLWTCCLNAVLVSVGAKGSKQNFYGYVLVLHSKTLWMVQSDLKYRYCNVGITGSFTILKILGGEGVKESGIIFLIKYAIYTQIRFKFLKDFTDFEDSTDLISDFCERKFASRVLRESRSRMRLLKVIFESQE